MEQNRWGRSPKHFSDDEERPSPRVIVQVYRVRTGERKGKDYMGKLEPEGDPDPESVKAAKPQELDRYLPSYETQRRWGGGKYEFRFLWRDEEEKRERRRSRIGRIEGRPLPKHWDRSGF